MKYYEMTTEELFKELDNMETKRFYLQMKDRWESGDWNKDWEYSNIISSIKKELAARA